MSKEETLLLTRPAAIQFMQQRYATATGCRWPVRRAIHKAQSGTGGTTYYWTEVDGIKAPPGWAFWVDENSKYFYLGRFYLKDAVREQTAIRRSDIPAWKPKLEQK